MTTKITSNEFREKEEYKKCMEKITNYSKGFEFSMKWYNIPKAKANALRIILNDAENLGLLELISDEWGWAKEDCLGCLEVLESRYRRI